ncbi:hypothetical protein HAX54_040286, partial [Datura stramonium]|nr:hypothetical protein [Datura stramonium]
MATKKRNGGKSHSDPSVNEVIPSSYCTLPPRVQSPVGPASSYATTSALLSLVQDLMRYQT